MITAIVISCFDHSHIKECIESINFVDEIIIIGKINTRVLSEIQTKQSIQFIESEYIDIDSLLKIASLEADNDWILGLEANHCVSKQLSEEILEIALKTDSVENYKVKTRFKFMGKVLKFSGYKSRYTTILFHISSIDTKIAAKKLKSPIEELYLDFDRYNERLTNKAKQKARYLFFKQKRTNFFHFSLIPLWKLKKIFIFKLGFLDGKEGFVFAYLKAFEEFKTYLFLWLIYRNIE